MIYEQSTGKLMSDICKIFGQGYAGNGKGKNNPAMQNVKNVGPLPCGEYIIDGNPYDSPHTGPYTIKLIPCIENQMFGRSDFRIHGDSVAHPGTASNGCIILPRTVREAIHNCTDKHLIVKP